MNFDSVEVKKLIEFAYHLHKSDFIVYWKYDRESICPEIEFVPKVDDGILGHPVKKLDKGMIEGYTKKNYGHSSAIPSLTVDVVRGEYIENGFIYDMAVRFELDGSLSNESMEERKLCVLMLKPDLSNCVQKEFPIIKGKKKTGFFDFDRNIPDLVVDGGYGDFDDDNVWDNMPLSEKLKVFLKAMEVIGFNKDDVISLLKGEKTAYEVFSAVAPPEIAHKQILYYNQREYTFQDNTLVNIKPLDIEVGADIGICLDDLPFPFEGPAIVDASLVNTFGIDFGENVQGHKLINVNSNQEAICRARLKNAIIDEVIDLAKVDASDTEFGHHVISNLDNSIGDLYYTNFLYAVDENGRRFDVNEYGRLKTDEMGNYAKATLEREKAKNSAIEVLADASSYEAAIDAFSNGAEGIGLVRTEDMFIKHGSPIYKEMFITKDEDKKSKVIQECARIQRAEAEKILRVANGKRVVFRLLDAKLEDFLTEEQTSRYFFNKQELRGDAALTKYPEFLEAQARAILEAAKNTDSFVDILVPINHSYSSTKEVRKVFSKIAEEIDYDRFRIGAMVEYTWFLNRADYIAYYADFIDIGLNDLTEDVTKMSRNSHHKSFAILDERVKALVREGVYRARIVNPEITIGFCGMHTNFAENLDFFSEVGANSITCNSQFVPTAKRLLFNDEKKQEEQLKLCLVLKKIRNNKFDNK